MEQPRLLQFSQQNPDAKSSTSDKQRHEHIMCKLRDTVFTTLSALNPSRTLTQGVKCHIEKKLHEFFPHFRTPTHPPYALMIRTAIIELNEEAGSSEESISGFIEKEYEGLPWAHAAFLSHHLRKLCETGEIVRKIDGRYIIVDHVDIEDKEDINTRQSMLHECHVRDELQNGLKEEVGKETCFIKQTVEDNCQSERQGIEVIDDRNKVKEKQIEVFEEQLWHAAEKQEVEERNEASRREVEATVQEIERPSKELNDDEQNYPQNHLLAVIEEPDHFQELQFEVSGEYTLVCGQQNKVIAEQNILQGEVMNEMNMEDQVFVTIPSAFETIDQCMDCNGLSFSLKEPCMELLTKKTEFQDLLIENFCSFEAAELREHDAAWPLMEKEKKDYLEMEKQLTKSPYTERASNVEVIGGQKQLREQEDRLIREESQSLEHQIQVETKELRLGCFNGDGFSENSSIGESPLLALKEDQKECLKQGHHQQQQTKSINGERRFSIVCGLLAQKKTNDQQKAPKSDRDNEQQPQSRRTRRRLHIPKQIADSTMSVLVPSDNQLDIEQKQRHPPEGQGRPSKPEGNGDDHGSLRIYVRRRRRP